MKDLELIATLWPQMPHYKYFAQDSRVAAIRLNTAMADPALFPALLDQALECSDTPLYVDLKGRQLRIIDVSPRTDHLELWLNHPISVRTPTMVLFKAGADGALLKKVEEDGKKLIFQGGPHYNLIKGESLQIRDPSLKVHGELFTPDQLQYMSIAKDKGISRFMLSYVTSEKEIAEMRKFVGNDEIVAKIETEKGLRYVQQEYVKKPNVGLLMARGDYFVEAAKPHHIARASRTLIRADEDAIVGSRILLSVTDQEVPECADVSDIHWLLDIGYRRFMFCDGLCLKKDALERGISVVSSIYQDYILDQAVSGNIGPKSNEAGLPPMPQPSKVQQWFKGLKVG